MKITKIQDSITVVFNDGTLLTKRHASPEMYEAILINQFNEEAVSQIMAPMYGDSKAAIELRIDMLENYDKSEYLTVVGSSVYITSISALSLPGDLAVAIWEAETGGNIELLSTYLNFWTLASMNTDAEARTNLFWFLTRYGMTISSSGLFVAYRNVVLKTAGQIEDKDLIIFITDAYTQVKFKHKKSPANYYVGQIDGEWAKTSSESVAADMVNVAGNLDELYNSLTQEETGPVYTDGYTQTFNIRIGEPVTMPREKCDANQNNTCSRGLHVAGKSWLQSNYFGDTGLRVLVNPADVVAVPPQDSYGKMRVCAYYPVAVVGFNPNGFIIDAKIEDGFEDNFIDLISYAGRVSNDEVSAYTIDIPSLPGVSRKRISARIDDIKAMLALKHGTGSN
tara:strand:- start:40719 stop:41903 length:1185 start_codon:yes stop_codon:yes gene_type:complete